MNALSNKFQIFVLPFLIVGCSSTVEFKEKTSTITRMKPLKVGISEKLKNLSRTEETWLGSITVPAGEAFKFMFQGDENSEIQLDLIDCEFKSRVQTEGLLLNVPIPPFPFMFLNHWFSYFKVTISVKKKDQQGAQILSAYGSDYLINQGKLSAQMATESCLQDLYVQIRFLLDQSK